MKFILASIVMVFSVASLAQPLSSASVNQLVDQLAPAEGVKTRSLRNLTVAPKSVDLVVQFDFDSAKLQEVAKPLLDNLSSAMKSDRLMDMKFNVEGHTDAKGSADYNLALSQKRALAVVQYLIESGVDQRRLSSVGKGYSELLFSDRPQAPENRRVRIIALP